MRLILDSGALIALERHDRAAWCRFKSACLAGEVPLTHGGIVGQTWRGEGSRQALLAKALDGVEIRALDVVLGRAAGKLLASARRSDVIDAALVLLASDADRIATSDPDDIMPLAAAAGCRAQIVRV